MGLMDAFKGMRISDPVDVDAQVVSVSRAPHATHGTAVMDLVVQPPGREAVAIECTSARAPVAKWPTPGGTLPVTVSASNPEKCRARWDDVPESGEIATDRAAQLAQQLNQGGGPGGRVATGVSGDVNEIVEALQQAMPGAQIEVEGAGSTPGGGAMPGASAGGAEDDRVAQLERLARLKQSGALTDQEFEREKARILGS